MGGGIVVEYFGYGFGFVGLTLFMMQQVAPGRHQMAHYAFASGIMNLSVMLTGMPLGFPERLEELPHLLPRGDARHHSGFCDHPAGSLYL